METKMLKNGLAECIFEPRGDNGLEGYQLGQLHKFEAMFGGQKNRHYFRIYPDKNDDTYFETCGTTLFKRYFKIVTEATF